jgi:hypothetical protein
MNDHNVAHCLATSYVLVEPCTRTVFLHFNIYEEYEPDVCGHINDMCRILCRCIRDFLEQRL